MREVAPDDFNAWLGLNSIVGREERRHSKKIPRADRDRRLCQDGVPLLHGGPRQSREEVVEASLIAAALRAGGAATHGAMALKFFDQQRERKKNKLFCAPDAGMFRFAMKFDEIPLSSPFAKGERGGFVALA
jgi:hypothetical protein